MSATDELRRLLDERGVEWDYGITGTASTMFNANGVELTFIDMRDGVTCSTILTPEQAIAATVGRGTCRNVHEPPKSTTFWPTPHFKCSECGATHISMEYVFYCPNCGRKLVDE